MWQLYAGVMSKYVNNELYILIQRNIGHMRAWIQFSGNIAFFITKLYWLLLSKSNSVISFSSTFRWPITFFILLHVYIYRADISFSKHIHIHNTFSRLQINRIHLELIVLPLRLWNTPWYSKQKSLNISHIIINNWFVEIL